ncbi:hypothetical protein GCM10020255_080190 [Rhodococcus baikonurensis]
MTPRRLWYSTPTTSPKWSRRWGYTDVLLEGGPRLAGAFLAAGYVDVIEAYIAPILLGAGASALVDAGVHTITDAHRFRLESAVTIGPDILLSLVPESSAPGNEE